MARRNEAGNCQPEGIIASGPPEFHAIGAIRGRRCCYLSDFMSVLRATLA